MELLYNEIANILGINDRFADDHPWRGNMGQALVPHGNFEKEVLNHRVI